MYSLKKHLEIQFDEDIYITRVRCGHPHLMMNSGYEGIRIIDSLSGTEVGRIKYPEFDFSVYTWVISPDGNMCYLFSPDEAEYALEVDLERFEARKINIPEDFLAPTQLCWFLPNLHIMDYKFRVWQLRENTMVKVDEQTTHKYYTRDYKRITKRFVVEKMNPDTNGLYVRSREYPVKHIGYLALEGKKILLMEQDGSAIDVAHYKSSLFVVFNDQIIQYQKGESRKALSIPEDESFISINVIIYEDVGYLNVVSSAKDYLNTPTSTLRVYRLQ